VRAVLALFVFLAGSLAQGSAIAQQSHKLTLVMAGDSFKGKPAFRVSLGPVTVGNGTVESASDIMVGAPGREAGYLETFEFPLPSLACLTKEPISIALTNDLWEQGVGDRNIYVESVEVDGLRLAARALRLVQDGQPQAILPGDALVPLYEGRSTVFADPPPNGWTTAADDCAETSSESVTPLYSSLLNFDLVVANPGNPIPVGAGGGLAPYPGGILIAWPQNGDLWRYDIATHGLHRANMALPPTNWLSLPAVSGDGVEIQRYQLRYNDIEIASADGQAYLLASYSYYDPDNGCVASRVARASLRRDWVGRMQAGEEQLLDWTVVFESKPCLSFMQPGDAPFGALQAGGRIALKDGLAYFTVGDYEIDGIGDKGPLYPQQKDNDYGKIFSLSMSDWTVSMVSMGHRNPQGITVDADGRIWEVEHGPAGGDELNLIDRGQNYGWPLVTLGMDYGSPDRDAKFWPYATRQGRHDGYVPPVFAWVPSIAPSNIKLIEGIDERWNGDLLLGSLAGQSLFRLRLSGAAVQYEERIPMGKRIRYVQPAEGRIFILFDDGEFGFLEPHKMLDGTDGATRAQADTLSSHGCMQCHSSAGAPRLNGIVGSDIAGQRGVDYSSALLAKPGAWTERALREFLSDTQAYAPGSKMPMQNLSSTALDDVVAALK